MIVALLVSSVGGFLLFRAFVSANSKPLIVATQTYLSLTPNPDGVGQVVNINFGLTQAPPTASGVYAERWDNFTVVVVKPDKATLKVGPFIAGASGGTTTLFTPTEIGNYSFQAFFGGQKLAGNNLAPGFDPSYYPNMGDYYLPSASNVTTLLVQALPLNTNVDGTVSSDTTWTPANSPYNLVGNVTVDNGVTLTVQPGASVYMNGFYIVVNGTLHAVGDVDNQIRF